MRYIKHHLESIHNVEIWPLISLMIFFLFFVALAWWVIRTRKDHVTYMKNRPLDDSLTSSEPMSHPNS